MTEPNSAPSAPETPPASKGAGRWLKIALALSLAANLAVVGVVAGAALKFQHGGDRVSGPRDLSFGPFTEALTRDQKRSLLRGMTEGGASLKDLRDALRADLVAVLAALKARPFDQAAFQTALEQQNARLSKRVEDGRRGLVDLVAQMSDEERQEFARNLERRLMERRLRN